MLLALALLAALSRAAIPVGFMPTARAGVLEMVICGADGVSRHAALDLGGDQEQSKPQASDHCVFATAAAGAQPALAASIAAPLDADKAHHTLLAADLVPGRGLAAPPPPSHAPPVLI